MTGFDTFGRAKVDRIFQYEAQFLFLFLGRNFENILLVFALLFSVNTLRSLVFLSGKKASPRIQKEVENFLCKMSCAVRVIELVLLHKYRQVNYRSEQDKHLASVIAFLPDLWSGN